MIDGKALDAGMIADRIADARQFIATAAEPGDRRTAALEALHFVAIQIAEDLPGTWSRGAFISRATKA